MPVIPEWLYQIIKLAIQIGSPYLLQLIKGWFKNLPPDIVKIIEELINALKNPTVSNSTARKTARYKFDECLGVGCPPKTKGN